MKRKIFVFGILIAVIMAVCASLAIAIPASALEPISSVIEVSQPVQLTNDGYYERGQSIVYDGANYWLFYGQSASYTGTYQSGGNPDGNDYVLYYKKATTVAGLASADATAVSCGTIQPTGIFNGETGAAYYDGKVWAFAPIADPEYPGREALYGWYYNTDASSWTAVGPFWDNKSRGSLHHAEINFDGELWIAEGAADGDVTTRHGNPDNQTMLDWADSQITATGFGGGGGIIHFFVNGGELYLAGLKCTEPKANIIYQYNTEYDAWDEIANVPSSGWDPTLFKVGRDYVFTQAPSTGSGASTRQYNISWSSNTLDNIFTNGSVATTEGKYGTNTWTDMWPIGFTAEGHSYLFFTSERNPDNPSSEIAGNIWYLPVNWDVFNNHYTYIQEAVNAAAPVDTINVAAGTYPEALNLGSKSLTIQGAGVDATIIDAHTFTGYAVQNFGNSSTISGLTLIGTGTGTSSYGFKVSHVNDITFSNVKVINSYKTAFDLNTVTGANLNDIQAINTASGFGLMILDSNNINVNNISTNGNAWGGVSVQTKGGHTDTISFSGTFNAQESIPLLLEQDPPNYYDITDVTIPDNLEYAVYAYRAPDNYKQTFYKATLNDAKTLALSLKAATAPTYSKIAIFDVAEANYYVIEGFKIQDAIDAATAGDTINVGAGTYNETIEINKSVTLLGAKHDVDPAGSTDRGGESIIVSGVRLRVTTAGATLNGFKLTGGDSSVTIDVIAHNVNINYNILENVPAIRAIQLYQADGTYVGYNTISGAAGCGIMTMENSNVVIEYNHIINCTQAGIEAVNHVGTGIVITHNTITNPGEKGVNYWAGIGGLISFNTITGSNWEGIFTDAAETEIRNNILHQCHNGVLEADGLGDWDYASIHLEPTATDCIIDGNIVSDGINGIQTLANNTRITNNEIYSMGLTYADEKVVGDRTYKNSAILIGSNWGSPSDIDPTGIVIEKNNIHSNYCGLFYSPDLHHGVSATKNWWGSASGPTHASNPSGNGDAVTNNVVYDPWYNSAGMTALASTKPVHNATHDMYYDTIQAAIDAATDGDTINVAAGTYGAAIDITKRITLQGAGSNNVTGTVLQNTGSSFTVPGLPYTNKPVVMISASGIEGSPLTIRDLMIRPRQDLVSGQLPGILLSPGSSISYINLDNVRIVGTRSSGTAEQGITLNDNTNLNHVVINNCEFRDMGYGIIFFNNTNTGTTAQNIQINNTTFDRNSIKGFYAEKLSNTTFVNVTVTNNGNTTLAPFWAQPNNAGIDINLKFGDYANIVFNNLTVHGNGVGSTNGAGLTVKARGTGSDSSYNSRPATLDIVTVSGGTFTGNEAAIRFGELGKGNTGPTNITIHNATITGNTQFGLSNVLSGVTINATGNWWGSANGPTHAGNTFNTTARGSVVIGAVNYAPWLNAGGGASFAPVTNGVNGYASIQAAVSAAISGNTITVASGTFSESVSISINNLTIIGNASSRPIITGGTVLNAGLSGLTFSNLYVRGNATADNTTVRMNGAITNLTVNNCVFDGENVAGRYGFTGGQIEGNLTITNSEFKNIMGWAVFDSKSGSGGDGSAMGTVTFHDNYIHNCNGSVVFRGLSTDFTDAVYIYNNIFENIGIAGVSEHWAAFEVNRANIVEIYHNRISGVVRSLEGEGQAMQLWQLGTVSIHDNNIANNYMGIAILKWPTDTTYNVAHISINSNNFTGNSQYALKVEDGLTGGPLNAINNWWGSVNGPTHTGNKYNVGHQGGIVLGNVIFTTWLKTAGGVSFAPVTNGANNYASIQAAINDATNGDTINVKPGVFTEAIVINKQLTLHGATWNVNKNGYTVPTGYAWDPTIESIIVHPNPTTAYMAIVDIVDIDNVTFQGFVVQELNAVDNLNSSLIRVYANTRQITNINVSNNIIGPNTNVAIHDGTDGRMGLYIVNHPYSNLYGVVNSTFSGNKIFDCKGNGDNVFIWSSYKTYGAAGPASMAGTVIDGNEIYGAHRSGIETAGGLSGLTIQNNKIYGNGGATVTGKPNIMYGNGIVLIRGSGDRDDPVGYGPVNVIINGNEIYNNMRQGIYLEPNNNGITITSNIIRNNGGDAVLVDLIGNYWNPDFETTPGPHSNLGGSQNIIAHLNRIYNNTGFGVHVNGSPTNGFRLNATNNWWGTTSATIVTTKVSGAVDYDPWHLKALVPTVGEITANSIVLNWTTDGVWSGDYYDFRYATTPINTNADWNNATRITGEPTPVNGAQTMRIRSLNGNTTYYFAFAITDSNYKSDISTTNAAKTLTTAVADHTAPNSVTNLAAIASSPASSSIVLTWTATGDDGANGLASKYIIKRSTNPIDAANFDAATTVFNSLIAKANGESETFTINKLNPNTTYYFAIKVQDEVPNTSAVSNIVHIQTANLLPTITGINPGTGDNDQARTITVDGTNFDGAIDNIVRLVNNNNVLALTSVTIISNTQLTAVVPKGAPTGTYNAKVINEHGTSALSTATYIITALPQPLPVVTNVIPSMATSGTPIDNVEIFGENFNGATVVTVDSHLVTILTVTATKINVNVPGMAAGEYDIRVTTPNGTNDISSVKYIVTDPVVIAENNTQDLTTSGTVDFGNTNVISVQLTLTTDNSDNATTNTNGDGEIEVVIPPNTTVTDSNGNPYNGTLNPPRVVKPDTTIQTDLPADAIVIEMGSTNQTINFNQDFVATMRVTATSTPKIYYFNKTTHLYELAGKAGVKDGITYRPGGTVLGLEDGVYTIGLLLDHMSVYVASIESLLAPTPTPTPTPGGGGTPRIPEEMPTPGTTNIRGSITSTGRFLDAITASSSDAICKLNIPAGTIGLDKDLKPLTEITISAVQQLPPLPTGWNIIGLAYNFSPSGASFDPAVSLTFKFDPTTLPENIDVNNLVLAYYDETTDQWVKLESVVDVTNNLITAKITHFTTFALVNIPKQAGFTLGSLSISPTNVVAGETVTISIIVTNTGDSAGNYTAILRINGVKEVEQSFTFAAEASQVISFDVVKEKAGTYDVNLNGLSGSFTVTAKPTPTSTQQPTSSPTAEPTLTPTATTTPTAAPVPTTNWGLIIGVSAGAIVMVGLLLFFLRRKARLS